MHTSLFNRIYSYFNIFFVVKRISDCAHTATKSWINLHLPSTDGAECLTKLLSPPVSVRIRQEVVFTHSYTSSWSCDDNTQKSCSLVSEKSLGYCSAFFAHSFMFFSFLNWRMLVFQRASLPLLTFFFFFVAVPVFCIAEILWPYKTLQASTWMSSSCLCVLPEWTEVVKGGWSQPSPDVSLCHEVR